MNILFFCESGSCSDDIITILRLGWPDLRCQTVPYVDEGYWILQNERPDLVTLYSDTLDLTVWRAIIETRRLSNVPITILVEEGDDAAMVEAINFGADEFINLTGNPTLVIARIAALMRRARLTRQHSGDWIQYGDAAINSRSKDVILGSEHLILTPSEFNLLYLLASHQNVTLSEEFIRQVLWSGYIENGISLYGQIQRLRLKLRGLQQVSAWIYRVGDSGYRFRLQPPESAEHTGYSD
jgi:DNA-binding response OmpR family regulator